MKKVLYDLYMAQPIGNSKFHGGGEYIKSVFAYFAKQYFNKIEISVFFDKDKYLDDYLLDTIEKLHIQSYDIKNLSDVENLLKREEFDVFFTGMGYDYGAISFPEGVKTIGTIHGLRSLECYSDKYEPYYKKGKEYIKSKIRNLFGEQLKDHAIDYFDRAIKNFDIVITDSYHSKYSIKSFFPSIDVSNIKVFYVPEKPIVEGMKSEMSYNTGSPYILLIGMNRWEKNGYRAILALEELIRKKLIDDYKIVVVGGLPKKIKEIIKKQDHYIFFDYVETLMLEELYKNCTVFLYPTLNEGFGLPPLEAMKYGKTCVVSAVCSVPELCGDAVYYINPRDLNEIQAHIIQALHNKLDEKYIKGQFEKINRIRKNDLGNLCRLIAEGEN